MDKESQNKGEKKNTFFYMEKVGMISNLKQQ